MTDQERLDMLQGKRKRLKRELRAEMGALHRKIAWIKDSLRESTGLPLDDKTIDQFGKDVAAAADSLEVKLYELAAVRDELKGQGR